VSRAAPLAHLSQRLRDDPVLLAAVGRTSPAICVPGPAQAIFLAAVAQHGDRRPLLVVVPTGTDADRLERDLGAFLGPEEVVGFPAWETLPFERVSPAIETMGRRSRVLHLLRDPERSPTVIIAPVRAALQRLAPEVETGEPIVVGVGDVVDQATLVARLVAMGYRRDVQVEHRGDLAVRGSIVDIYPSTADAPIRIDLWGDEVDRMSAFAVADQRSTDAIAEAEIFACRELLLDEDLRGRAARLVGDEPWGREQWDRLADGLTFDGMESWLPWLASDEEVIADRLGADGLVVLVEPRRCRDRAATIIAEETDLAESLSRTWGVATHEAFPPLHLAFDRLLVRTDAPMISMPAVPEGPDTPLLAASGWDRTGTEQLSPVRVLERLVADGFEITVSAEGEGSAERLRARLVEDGVEPGDRLLVSPLEHGVVLAEHRIAIATEAELTGRRRTHRRQRARRREAQGFFEDLAPGNYVVHQHHGVARYGGMVTRTLGGVERDYLLLEYRGGDKLYLPTDQIEAIRHYTGGDSPSLSRMGGGDWQRTKAKVRSAVTEIAQELVVLYQKRVNAPGHAFPEDTPWQREMEAAFPFQETPDQLDAIESVKADMEREVPMDRLICGDVGFGKTEVAIRAAFKAVQDGRQVAVLVPTTLLAQQHFATFSERFAPYPIRVEVLSRFLSAAEARAVAAGVREGSVDVVIGTHRLLSEDISFPRLGLLVVDEEQRFGVQHKESMKKLKADVDVLTLSATPIPRTLEMSLTGIRDLTILHTPPADRQPILTYVGEYDERPVGEAIRRELLREGQVFFVHNRVSDIDHVAAGLRDLVPEARVAVAHGQMDEAQLERVVIDFWEGQYDVLVCTTIIESGIDMPTVNTLVVDRADMLGLGQLHQLRGRVGRAGQRAYAYLFTPPDRILSEEAEERLKTIAEATELGSGFKIAMRDLEIRGAGNLLGTGQSGHIAAVGYDLYCQLVTEAVAELKGEELPQPVDLKIEVPLDAHLPTAYVPKEELRLEAYRRLAAVSTNAEVADIRDEWVDRYGPIPAPAEALLAVATLRAECVRLGIKELSVVKGSGFPGPKLMARMAPVSLPASKVVRLERLYKGAVYKPAIGELQLPLKAMASSVDELLAAFADLLPPPDPA
jgi:transcription-repair coupling factor (superfamily II helicase)